ncbi:ribonuclease E/G, partial [Actinomyces bouchesdurhonensis]|uniref:ribonuclease E/G n=1 Tax=Actinomyces bouchesdurhonensis TaxID=1852361 RepID=UPI003C763EFD
DRTEAMTVIDVNTGKFIGAGGTLEETVTRNNLEAAEEIVRQLRLRDIGGIVIIDFVDMVLESNRDLVLRRLVECLGRDRTRHQVTEITSLGLVQMTRKRVGEGLVEAFSTPCEACEGRGFIVHHHPVENSGSDSSSKSSNKASKKQQKKTESHHIEDHVDHERAKEALSAIAAASTRKDDEASARKEGAAQKRSPRRVRAESGDVTSAQEVNTPVTDQSASKDNASDAPDVQVPADPDAQTAMDSGVKRPRRRRRVAETTPMPDLPIYIDLPDPVESADQVPVPLKDASDIQLPEQHEKAPATRRRTTRKVATASSAEPAEAPAVPAERHVEDDASTAEVSPAEVSAPQLRQDPTARKARKHRAVASTGIVEPEAAPAPIVVELPARAEVVESSIPTLSTDDIRLPEASDQPRAKHRRRVVSTGIVDAG